MQVLFAVMDEYLLKDFTKIIKKNAVTMRAAMLPTDTDVFRIYNRNLEEIPLTVDLYGAYARVEDSGKDSLSDEARFEVIDAISRFAYVDEEKIVYVYRAKQPDYGQHGTLNNVSPDGMEASCGEIKASAENVDADASAEYEDADTTAESADSDKSAECADADTSDCGAPVEGDGLSQEPEIGDKASAECDDVDDANRSLIHPGDCGGKASAECDDVDDASRNLIHPGDCGGKVSAECEIVNETDEPKTEESNGEEESATAEPVIVNVRERGHVFRVNLSSHIDTGLFLDQRERRALIESQSEGKRVLNLFSYTGSFSVYAASGGAREVVSVDLSNTYTEWARENLSLNGFTGENYRCVAEDALSFVNGEIERGARYNIVIFDPPVFSNSNKMEYVFRVQKDWKTWISLLYKLLTDDGFILFSTNLSTFEVDRNPPRGLKFIDITADTRAEGFTKKAAGSSAYLFIKEEDVKDFDWKDAPAFGSRQTGNARFERKGGGFGNKGNGGYERKNDREGGNSHTGSRRDEGRGKPDRGGFGPKRSEERRRGFAEHMNGDGAGRAGRGYGERGNSERGFGGEKSRFHGGTGNDVREGYDARRGDGDRNGAYRSSGYGRGDSLQNSNRGHYGGNGRTSRDSGRGNGVSSGNWAGSDRYEGKGGGNWAGSDRYEGKGRGNRYSDYKSDRDYRNSRNFDFGRFYHSDDGSQSPDNGSGHDSGDRNGAYRRSGYGRGDSSRDFRRNNADSGYSREYSSNRERAFRDGSRADALRGRAWQDRNDDLRKPSNGFGRDGGDRMSRGRFSPNGGQRSFDRGHFSNERYARRDSGRGNGVSGGNGAGGERYEGKSRENGAGGDRYDGKGRERWRSYDKTERESRNFGHGRGNAVSDYSRSQEYGSDRERAFRDGSRPDAGRGRAWQARNDDPRKPGNGFGHDGNSVGKPKPYGFGAFRKARDRNDEGDDD